MFTRAVMQKLVTCSLLSWIYFRFQQIITKNCYLTDFFPLQLSQLHKNCCLIWPRTPNIKLDWNWACECIWIAYLSVTTYPSAPGLQREPQIGKQKYSSLSLSLWLVSYVESGQIWVWLIWKLKWGALLSAAGLIKSSAANHRHRELQEIRAQSSPPQTPENNGL